MGKKKDTDTVKVSTPPKTYALGPQSDGAVVVRIPGDFHLMVLRKAAEKQSKNAVAADGTIGALAEGDDPFLSRVQTTLQDLVKLLASARAPENQIADTPIGREMTIAAQAALAGETLEPIDGQDGTSWAPHVPKPRPKLGQLIRWPTGQAESITKVVGWNPDESAFEVNGENMRFAVVAHAVGPDVEWRLLRDVYDTPLVAPPVPVAPVVPPVPVTDETPAATSSSSSPSSQTVGDELVEGTTLAKTPAKQAMPANTAQRARNAATAGLRPVPKPSAAKGGKKGGKK